MSQKKKYLINEEQLEQIEYYKLMFDHNAELIQNLCSAERDDVVYGFTLGEIHSHLRKCFMGMKELEESVRKALKTENNE